MHRLRKMMTTAFLLAAAVGLQGCIGFSGPNGIRNAIVRQQNVKLDKEFGVDVGPIGVALANALASQYIPVSLDGIWSVSFGEYHVKPTDRCSLADFCLDDVELDGYQPFVRVRETGSTVKLMHNANGKKINKMVVMTQSGTDLVIAKVEGDFDKIINNIFESGLLDDVEIFDGLDEPYDTGSTDEPLYADVGDAAPPDAVARHPSATSDVGSWW